MKIKCVVQDDDSIIFYKNDEVFIYMVRKPKWGGRFIGEIYNADDELLIKLDSNVFRSIKIIYQNLEIPFYKKSYFFWTAFILNHDCVRILDFLIYSRIYWNNTFIADTKLINLLNYNINLELHFNINDDEQIYYTCIFFCITCLYMR